MSAAIDFNCELFQYLNCSYLVVSDALTNFMLPSDQEKSQQQLDLEALKKSYREDDIDVFFQLLSDYVLNYVYSKRIYEAFPELEAKHSIDHNLRVAYFVKNVLSNIDSDLETKKLAVIFAVLHDVAHRGSPDFTDHELVIQSILFVKTISGIQLECGKNILINRDRIVVDWRNQEEMEKNKLFYVSASLISLGDCVDYKRYGKISKIILNQRINNVCVLTGISRKVLEEICQRSINLCSSMDDERRDREQPFVQISQDVLKRNFDLCIKILNTSKKLVETFTDYLLYQSSAKPLTMLRNQSSFREMRILKMKIFIF